MALPPGATTAERVGAQIFEAIAASGAASDEQLSSLHFLFDSHFAKALQIVDQGGVWCFQGASSGRKVYQVHGQSAESYLVFPEHYCSCQAFFFDVVSKSEAVACKHQLAVRLARALSKARVRAVNDLTLAHLLQE